MTIKKAQAGFNKLIEEKQFHHCWSHQRHLQSHLPQSVETDGAGGMAG